MTLAERVVNRALLIQVGSQALLMIKERTLAGQFLPGSTGTSAYSTTPMPLPWNRLQSAVRGSATLRNMIDSGEATVFTSKRGRKWIVLEGGYRKMRELAGKSTDHVTLSWRGTMLRDLKIKTVDVAGLRVDLGFTDTESERIASYHQELGAGRRRVTHKFMGFTEGEKDKLSELIAVLIVKQNPA
jgi:hypothetical protein